jgi:hypothetical protein
LLWSWVSGVRVPSLTPLKAALTSGFIPRVLEAGPPGGAEWGRLLLSGPGGRPGELRQRHGRVGPNLYYRAGPVRHKHRPIATSGLAAGREPAMRVIGATQPSCRTAAGAPLHVYQHPGRAARRMVLRGTGNDRGPQFAAAQLEDDETLRVTGHHTRPGASELFGDAITSPMTGPP